jgi:hypothetical protein
MTMDCMRLGGNIPSPQGGCCAYDFFQGFTSHPDDPHAVELSYGDAGISLKKYAGRTNREVFETYLRIGTFDAQARASRGFLAVMNDNQVHNENGRLWLAILKANGFQFLGAVHNSVYSNSRPNYLFGLFRNHGPGALTDPFRSPPGWDELPPPEKTPGEIFDEGKTRLYDLKDLADMTAPYSPGYLQVRSMGKMGVSGALVKSPEAVKVPVEKPPVIEA